MPSQLLNPDPGWQEPSEALDIATVCYLESKSSEAAGAVLMWKLVSPFDTRLELQAGLLHMQRLPLNLLQPRNTAAHTMKHIT